MNHINLANSTGGLWNNDPVQFARLLSEICATHSTLDVAELSHTMDLDHNDVVSLFSRAQRYWEAAKLRQVEDPEQTVKNDALSRVVEMAAAHVEDIESGIADGTYSAGDNQDLAAKKQALTQVMLSAVPPDAVAGITPELGVPVHVWDAYGKPEDTPLTHAMNVFDERTTFGQVLIDVRCAADPLIGMAAIEMALARNPIKPEEHVAAAHVYADSEDKLMSIYWNGPEVLIVPQSQVDVSCFGHLVEGEFKKVYLLK